MKDYNEMAKAVFERRDEFVAKRQQRRATLLKAGVPVCALALVCLLSVTLRFDKLPEMPTAPTRPISATSNTENTENTEITANQNTGEDVTLPHNTDSVQKYPDPTEPKATKPGVERPTEGSNSRPTGTAPDEDNSTPAPTEATTPDVDPTEPPWELPTDGPVVDEPGPNGRPDESDPPKPTEPMYPGITEPDYTYPECPGEPPAQAPSEPSDPTVAPTEGWFPNDTEPMEPDVTEPDTVAPTDPTEEPTDATQVEATVSEPVYEKLEDDTPFTYPEESTEDELLINCDGRTYSADVGDKVTYVVEMKAYEPFISVQLKLEYDCNLMQMLSPINDDYVSEAEAFPNIASSFVGCGDGWLKMNAVNLNGYDFRKRSVLMTVEFEVLSGGEIDMDFVMEEMERLLGGDYFYMGEQVSFDIEIYEYILVN